MKEFKIVSLNVSTKKGVKKSPVPQITVEEGFGIAGDAHGGDWHRQISLLALEDIKVMQNQGFPVKPGDFAENITTENIDLTILPLGTKLFFSFSEKEVTDTNADVILEVTQIGKECHSKCAIYYEAGDCVMPKRGIFAKVVKGGLISNESSGYYSL